MKFSVFPFSVLLVVTFLFSPVSVSEISAAQTTATLSGTIIDQQGAAIAGAQVQVDVIPSTNVPMRVVSNSEGRFSFSLSPGRYRIRVSRDAFLQIEQEIVVAAGESRALNFRMILEPLSSKVVVTAQGVPLEVDSSPSPVTIVTRQEIDRRSATSLPDLLATLPGFSIGRNNAEGGVASLFLDGGNSNYTKVLVDGAPVNQPGGLIDFSNFSLDGVDKIEVVHGAESALYGSDAMSGVIQIFTHRGTTRIPEFTAFAEGGNFSTGRGGAQLSGMLGQRFDYSSSFSDFQTPGQGPNDAFRNRTLSGNFGWRVNNDGRVSLALRDNVSAAGTPGATAFGTPANLQDNAGHHNFSANLRAEISTGSHWHHQLNGTESYYRETDFDPSFTTFLQYNRASIGGQSSYVTSQFGFTGGYEYEVENGFVSYLGVHARRNNQAGYLDARWQPFTRLTLSAGARAEDNANFGTKVVPRAGILYALRLAQGAFGDTRLRASYGQGIVEPRFDQTFGTDPCFPGNLNLLPERSRTVHAGIDQKLASDRVLISADYFDNRFRDIISFGFSGTPPLACTFGAGTFFNTNLARARGASISAEASLTHWLTASANYTYNSTRVISAPDTSDPNYIPGSRLLRRPLNSGNVALNAGFRRMHWNLSGYFTGRRDDYPILGRSINPGYARFDFAGSYNLARGISVYGRIANLADKKYQEVLGYPALGREFRIGLKYTTRHE